MPEGAPPPPDAAAPARLRWSGFGAAPVGFGADAPAAAAPDAPERALATALPSTVQIVASMKVSLRC
jgi:hypothetical protein